METALDLPGLSQMEFFMIITPLPEIREEIDFKHVFDIDKEDIKLLNEARTEFIAAMKDCLDNVRLIISSAETYLERLVEALGKVETIKTKKKQTIEWGRIFSEVGKTKVKIKPKCKDHYRVEVYMVVHTLAVLYKQQAERVICDNANIFNSELKDKVKESGNLLKESYSRAIHLTEKGQRTFCLPVKNQEELYEAFTEFNKYLVAIIDVHYHMIQIEYPIDQKKAYGLACRISGHTQTVIEQKLKPGIVSLMKLFPKDKELKWAENYINILKPLLTSIKWLCRGLEHHQEEEKLEGYAAINEAKENGQHCYDYFEKSTEKNSTYYMEYVERWLNFIAKNYEYFEDLAKNIDHMNMDSAYTGDRFDGDNLLEKKGKVEAYAVDGFSKAFE